MDPLDKDAPPLSYKPFTLKDYQKKLKNSDFSKLQNIKELFFSGQFTKFAKILLANDQEYFLDTVHFSIALQ